MQYHICSLKTCMTNCDTQQGCVAIAQIKRDCYMCNNETNDGLLVTDDVQSRYLLWREHLLQIEGIYNASQIDLYNNLSFIKHNHGKKLIITY